MNFSDHKGLRLVTSLLLFWFSGYVYAEEVVPPVIEEGAQEEEVIVEEIEEIEEEVMPAEVAPQEITPAETAPEEVVSQLTTRMFKIRYLSLEQAQERVEELLSKEEELGASVKPVTVMRNGEELNFLVVKDTPQKMEEIARVLENLEKEFAPVTVNMDFTDVALSQILATIAQVTGLNIIGGEELSQKVSVHLKEVPLEDVFDILLKTTGYTYVKEEQVLRIIPQEELPLITEVFELEYTTAQRVKEAIAHLVSEAGEVKVFSKLAEEKHSNILIVTETEESLEIIRELIKSLDKRVGQVMIEAKFCEVRLNKDDELGIDWNVRAQLTGASTQTRFPLPMTGAKRLNRPDSREELTGTITLGTISFADFSATLRALDTETEINIISNPRIATRDGEEAQILVGEKIPIPIYERNPDTGTFEITGYEEEEVGVLLRVTPIINQDNTVTLELHPEVSEITGYTGPNDERPIISTREVTTVFTVETGRTVVLGGLMKQTLSKSLDKVPGLSKIPFLGRLFSFQDDSDERTELLIFITPQIIEAPEIARAEIEAPPQIPEPEIESYTLEELYEIEEPEEEVSAEVLEEAELLDFDF